MNKFWFAAFAGLLVGAIVHVGMVVIGAVEANFWALLATVAATTIGAYLGIRSKE